MGDKSVGAATEGAFRTFLPLVAKDYGPTPPPVGGQQGDGLILTDYMEDFILWMRIDLRQGRPEVIWNTKLARVALTRVMKMAHEGWVGHTDPQGRGADWYVRQGGFILPPWYYVVGQGEAGNHVESLAWGGWLGTTAKHIWDLWIDSPHHYAHIMGQESYATQTQVGIACYYLEGSKEKMYTSLIAAPPEPAHVT